MCGIVSVSGVMSTLLVFVALFMLIFLCSWGWPLLVSATDLINVRGLTRQI